METARLNAQRKAKKAEIETIATFAADNPGLLATTWITTKYLPAREAVTTLQLYFADSATESIRKKGVRLKRNVNRALIKGKRLILVDDSVVRGTTSRKIKDMILDAGAGEVHFRIASPPTAWPCFYGVDTPERSKLLAAPCPKTKCATGSGKAAELEAVADRAPRASGRAVYGDVLREAGQVAESRAVLEAALDYWQAQRERDGVQMNPRLRRSPAGAGQNTATAS